MTYKNKNRGVTLVEIAIVLVIIGLLLGGVLKGQELINNAKVRSIADRQNSLKVAWFSFIDRFQALPGDYVRAVASIPGSANGNGDAVITIEESPIVLQHLTGAGYLRCPQCTSKATNETPSAKNSLQNQYGGVMSIFHDSQYYAAFGSSASARLYIHTGPNIPSNIIAEVDRKLDDGIANTGDMVFNYYTPVGIAPVDKNCMAKNATANDTANAKDGLRLASTPQAWRGATANPPVEQNCGASVAI